MFVFQLSERYARKYMQLQLSRAVHGMLLILVMSVCCFKGASDTVRRVALGDSSHSKSRRQSSSSARKEGIASPIGPHTPLVSIPHELVVAYITWKMEVFSPYPLQYSSHVKKLLLRLLPMHSMYKFLKIKCTFFHVNIEYFKESKT